MRRERVLAIALGVVCLAGIGGAVIAGIAAPAAGGEGITAALTADLEHRNAQSLVDGAPQPAEYGVPESTSTPDRLAAIAEEDTRLRAQRDRFLSLGESFTAFETEVTIDSLRITGETATVSFTESTTLQRTPSETGEAAPDYAYSFPQEATLRLQDGMWAVDTLSQDSASTAADIPETVAAAR